MFSAREMPQSNLSFPRKNNARPNGLALFFLGNNRLFSAFPHYAVDQSFITNNM